jgi:hypothetical protein
MGNIGSVGFIGSFDSNYMKLTDFELQPELLEGFI